MAEQKAKGSIIYELLIVILAVALVVSIVYPKKLQDQEQRNTELCRFRMSQLYDAELQFLKYNRRYTDTLSVLIDFVRSDSSYAHYMDSVIVAGLDSVVTKLDEFESMQQTVRENIPAATDSVMIDSLANILQDMKMEARSLAGYVEYIHDKMKNLPNTPIETLRQAFLTVDSKKFTLDMDITKNLIESGLLKDADVAAREVNTTIGSVRQQFESVIASIPEYKGPGLDSLQHCPSVHRDIHLVHVDTSAIKFLNVYCPIDSTDVERVESDFLKSNIGGLNMRNHGHIEKGEKSWEST